MPMSMLIVSESRLGDGRMSGKWGSSSSHLPWTS